MTTRNLPARIQGGYALWSLETSMIPARSMLISLEPIGMGSAHVEGLASYLTRLARAHAVHVSTLRHEVIIPLLLSLYPDQRSHPSGWEQQVLNGSNECGERYVAAIEQATLQQNLRQMTMLPWRNLLSRTQLLRPTRAWCPLCYRQWQTEGATVYDPLIWSLMAILVCPRHHCVLQDSCPQCGSRQAALPNTTVLDRCRRCGCGLDSGETPSNNGALTEPDHPEQVWRSEWVGNLLASVSSQTNEPLYGMFGRVLTRHVRTLGHGTLDILAHQIPTSRKTLHEWARGETKPWLIMFMRVCECFNVPPQQFLSDAWQPTHPPIDPDGLQRRTTLRQSKQYDADQVERALNQALHAPEPISLSKVARQQGCSKSYLNRQFPELSHALSSRRRQIRAARNAERVQQERERIRQVTIDLHRSGIYPSMPRICKFIGVKVIGAVAFATWRDTMRELGFSK